MGRKNHAMHGRDHSPRGSDPSVTERWHIFGDSGEPAFQHSWTNISGYTTSRFRLIVGPTAQEKQTLEIILHVTGGSAASVVATLPSGYYDFADGAKVAIHGHDSVGAYKAFHLDGSTGDIVEGV